MDGEGKQSRVCDFGMECALAYSATTTICELNLNLKKNTEVKNDDHQYQKQFTFYPAERKMFHEIFGRNFNATFLSR